MSCEEARPLWQNYWSAGDPAWHVREPNAILVDHLDKLAAGKEGDHAGSVLVPLAGKSLDPLYLYRRGFKVVAVEYCEEVARQLLQHHGLPFRESYKEDFGRVFSTGDGRLTYLCGDMLKVTPELTGGQVSMVWDRAAIVALVPQDLDEYARVLKSLVGPGGRVLMVLVHYDHPTHSGPPIYIPPQRLNHLFEDRFTVQLIEKLGEGGSVKQYLVPPDKEYVYFMTAP